MESQSEVKREKNFEKIKMEDKRNNGLDLGETARRRCKS